MSSLLEQAIVDATALKEAAMKNAETQIIEKYSSEIKDAVETLLNEQPLPDEDEEDLPAPEDMEMDLGAEGTPELEVPDVPHAHTDGDELCDCPDKEGEGEGKIEVDLDDIAQMAASTSPEDMAPPESHEAALGALEEEVEIDLNQLLLQMNEDESSLEEEENFELSEDVLEELLDVQIEPVKSGWLENSNLVGDAADEALAAEQSDVMEEEDELEEEKEKEVKEAIESLKGKIFEVAGINEKIELEKESLLKENSKMRNLIIRLKDRLDEVNTSNAKLLYTNRTLSSTSLNERQKDKVAEAISSATSVEEAKTIFETLQSAVGGGQKRQPKSLSEAVSRGSSTTLPRREKSAGVEHVMQARMKALAGIK